MPQRTTKKKRPTTNQNRKRRSRSGRYYKSNQILCWHKIYCLVTNILDSGTVLNLNPNKWLLPETKDYLQTNDNKEKPTSDTENEQKIEGIFN